MSFEISNNYGASYYTQTNTATKNSSETKTASAINKNSAKEYYDELCEKYSNLNILTGSYKVGTTFGTGRGNVMIHPEYLKKAANDPKVAAELEKNLSDIPAAEKWLDNMCRMNGMEVVAGGVVIDENGGMSSWTVTRTARTKEDHSAQDEKTDLSDILENYQKEQKEKIARLERIKANHIAEKEEVTDLPDEVTESIETQIKISQRYNTDIFKNSSISLFNAKV